MELKEFMNNECLQSLLDRLEDKYGDLDNNNGCYVSTNNGSHWLSVQEIVDLIIMIDNEYEYDY